MFSIGEWMQDIFGPYGSMGVLLCIFLIFFIDALIFPTLPEIFFMVGFFYDPGLSFGLQLLLVAILAEVAGITLLYLIVEKIRVPKRIKDLADRYVKFLICSDERILLINRIAPTIPFAGAFISLIDSWKLSRALFYVVLGCVLKYGAILLMADLFFRYFSGNSAQTYTFIFVISIMVLSLIASFVRKKRSGITDEDS